MLRRFHKLPRKAIAKADPVTPEVRDFVYQRDGRCVASIIEPMTHLCRDKWGMPHRPDDTWKLTLEHVKDELRMSKRAESDPAHLVVLCYGANVGVPSKELRAAMRAYLKDVASEHDGHVDPCPGCPKR